MVKTFFWTHRTDGQTKPFIGAASLHKNRGGENDILPASHVLFLQVLSMIHPHIQRTNEQNAIVKLSHKLQLKHKHYIHFDGPLPRPPRHRTSRLARGRKFGTDTHSLDQ